MTLRPMIGDQRRELVEILRSLDDQQWDMPSLCVGWRVREVVAHIVMPFRYPTKRYARALRAAGGDFNPMADISEPAPTPQHCPPMT